MPGASVNERTVFNERGQLVVRLDSRSPDYSVGLFVLDTNKPVGVFRLEGEDAVIRVTTIPGKRLGVRRTTDLVNYTTIASDIVGDGEVVEIRDPGVAADLGAAYYLVVDEGDL